eukprot:COSAG06_NODE_2847_length_6184_cov_4.604930_1_plen_165_part_00
MAQLFKRPQVSAASSKSLLQTPSDAPQKDIHDRLVEGAHSSKSPPVRMLPATGAIPLKSGESWQPTRLVIIPPLEKPVAKTLLGSRQEFCAIHSIISTAKTTSCVPVLEAWPQHAPALKEQGFELSRKSQPCAGQQLSVGLGAVPKGSAARRGVRGAGTVRMRG